MKLRIRSDFIRVARAFTIGATGPVEFYRIPSARLRATLETIYVEPHPSGVGATIVATDSVAMVVQRDRKATIDQPYCISGVTARDRATLSGGNLNDRWLTVDDDGKVSVEFLGTEAGGKVVEMHNVTVKPARIGGESWDDSGSLRYLNWRNIMLTNEELAATKPGYPGMLNLAHMAAVGRMYEDGSANCRIGHLRHFPGNPFSPMVMTFPWRADMVVFICPTLPGDGSTDDWETKLLGDIDEMRQPPAEPGIDPASDL